MGLGTNTAQSGLQVERARLPRHRARHVLGSRTISSTSSSSSSNHYHCLVIVIVMMRLFFISAVTVIVKILVTTRITWQPRDPKPETLQPYELFARHLVSQQYGTEHKYILLHCLY